MAATPTTTSTLTYQLGDDVDHGELVLNADGSFTYTPSMAARVRAGLTRGDDFDSFTVTVRDRRSVYAPVVTVINVKIDPATLVVTATIPLGSFASNTLALSPDGTRAYYAETSGDSVTVIDTATNTVIGAPIIVGGNPDGVVVSPDGTRVYTANTPDSVSVIDTERPTPSSPPSPSPTFRARWRSAPTAPASTPPTYLAPRCR